MIASAQPQLWMSSGTGRTDNLRARQLVSSTGRLQSNQLHLPAAAARQQQRQRAVRVAAARVDPEAPRRRVVVTGQGLVSCLGHDPTEFYDNLLAGKSGIRQIQGFDASFLPTTFAGEVRDLDSSGYVVKKWEKRIDPVMKYTHVAGKKALEAAGLPWQGPEIKDLNLLRAGIIIGSAFGGFGTFATAMEALVGAGFKRMNPFCIPFAIQNMGGAMLAMDVHFMGPNYPIATACATGNYCIMSAAEHIRRGEADLMLAGASEACIIPSGMAGFVQCRALSERNAEPERASRPWDQGRDGFVMGEGAGVLVLEEYEHAKARGAPILAELLGGAFTCDAYDMTSPEPNGKGVIMCIERALADAGVAPEEVDYVNAHATSTPAGDMAEYRAITTALPHKSLKINSSKSMIGHLLGAAGAVEAVACVQALRTGWLHPNLNLDNPEEGVDLSILVGKEKEQTNPSVVLSNSFGFGGHNSAILFGKVE